jgi:hypothetical protein
MNTRFPRLLMATATLGLVLGSLGGCSTVKPWVKPYERTNLADPIMSFGRDPVAGIYLHHVYQARESARGAEGGGGGGCGCN